MKLPWRWPFVRLPGQRPNLVEDASRAASVATAQSGAAPKVPRNAAGQNLEASDQMRGVDSPLNHAVDVAVPSSTRLVNSPPVNVSVNASSSARTFPHSLPKPALRWVGDGGRVALREFDFARDADVVCSWQKETYSLNFPDFRYTDGFASAFRHDLRRGALDPHHAIFVLDDGQLLGFLWLVICENTWTGDRYGYVNNVYLVPTQRGQGLAREMMAHAERWFRSRGIKRARLTVTSSNNVACKLYESCGYETTRWEMEKEL